MTYTTDDYILKISKMSDRFGDKLIALMDKYNKMDLKNITFNEAKTFYEELVKNNNDN